jgi:two-component system, NarL family, sensor histidine kinase DesK
VGLKLSPDAGTEPQDINGVLADHGRVVRHGMALIWLLLIIVPFATTLVGNHQRAGRGFTAAGVLALVAIYLYLFARYRRGRSRPARYGRLLAFLLSALYVISLVLTLASGPEWGFLFTYCVAPTALSASKRAVPGVVVGTTILAGAASALAGSSGGNLLGLTLSTAGVGLLMLVMRDLRVRNEELTCARAELARLAVAQERQRFARDLHDLLGHSLSVIALKAELAGRLLPDRANDAAREVSELEQVARTALGEVREAVSGYRQLTIDGELGGARMALSAAGIEADIRRDALDLPDEAEAVLAWAVREGATNVLRHSRAQRCRLSFRRTPSGAELEVLDDGIGAAGAAAVAGNGLAGLAERAHALNGRVLAGPQPSGGYRLAVEVPMAGLNGSGG